VYCRGNVLAEEAIMHSRVTAFKHCVLNGRRSEVIASDLVVGGSFWCKKFGNFNEAPTRLSVGVDPVLLLDYRSAAADMERKQAEWDKTEYQAEQLGKLVKDGRSDERTRQARLQVQAELDRLGRELAALRGRFPLLRESIIPARGGLVVVEETMFKGAVVIFGPLEYRAPDAGIRKTVLRAGADQVLESGFNYREKPEFAFDSSGS
jgi:hypothetical protein